jgi:hypothetical protein
MPKRNRTRAEQCYHDRVAQMPCVLCELLGQGPSAAQLHHIREGQGMSQRASHWLVIPLCPDCHTGPQGLHGDRTLFRLAKVDELDLLALTIERLQAVA